MMILAVLIKTPYQPLHPKKRCAGSPGMIKPVYDETSFVILDREKHKLAITDRLHRGLRVVDMKGISPAAGHQYDRELHLENWKTHLDGPFVLLFHDRDISLDHNFMELLPINSDRDV